MEGIRFTRLSGFTLIELMVVISLVSILQGMAIPAFSRFVENIRIYHAAHELRVDLRAAQAASARTRQALQVCPSTDGLSCDPGKLWQHGWIAYREIQSYSGEQFSRRILFHQQAKNGLRISHNGNGNSIRFSPDYRIGSNLSFSICGASGKVPGLEVVVTQVGRVRIKKTDVSC